MVYTGWIEPSTGGRDAGEPRRYTREHEQDRIRPQIPADCGGSAPLDNGVHTLQSVHVTTGGKAPLNPTLWRTCRVLANPVRLRMLGVLLQDGELSVTAVAGSIGVSTVVGSQYLRALNARGLLAARRESRWVFYRPAADPSVHVAVVLFKALEQVFAGSRRPHAVIFRQATAMTHPRRVQIVRALAHATLTEDALSQRTGISRFALRRHLSKLARRGFVKRARRTWRLAKPRWPFAAAVMSLACD